VAGLIDGRGAWAAETALETTSVRLIGDRRVGATCLAPQFLAEELLRAEGFTDIRYVPVASDAEMTTAVAADKADFTMLFAPLWVSVIDQRGGVTVLAGVHAGCVELFGNASIRSIADLKGKNVAVQALGGIAHMFLSMMAMHVGLDPKHDMHLIVSRSPGPLELFASGKADAFIGFPPGSLKLRARGIGHVLVSTAIDHPWSDYFCCMFAGNREYVRKYPNATKSVLRAILKAADFCATAPANAARSLINSDFLSRDDYALQLQALRENPYAAWRELDAEDTLRFYALRLKELGFIASTPQKIIADGTDWRFLDKLKRELKA
jgi:NitT/TauT family transport system substrate-binding protein